MFSRNGMTRQIKQSWNGIPKTCVFLSKPEFTLQKNQTLTKPHKRSVRWCILKRRKRLGMAVAGNTSTASFLTKIGKMQSARCQLCRIAREARGEGTDGLAAKTHDHINSAGCEGMTTTLRLPTTPSGGTCMTTCTLHNSQMASSSLCTVTILNLLKSKPHLSPASCPWWLPTSSTHHIPPTVTCAQYLA